MQSNDRFSSMRTTTCLILSRSPGMSPPPRPSCQFPMSRGAAPPLSPLMPARSASVRLYLGAGGLDLVRHRADRSMVLICVSQPMAWSMKRAVGSSQGVDASAASPVRGVLGVRVCSFAQPLTVLGRRARRPRSPRFPAALGDFDHAGCDFLQQRFLALEMLLRDELRFPEHRQHACLRFCFAGETDLIDQGEHAIVLGVKLLIADREALTPRQRVEQGAPNDERLDGTVAVVPAVKNHRIDLPMVARSPRQRAQEIAMRRQAKGNCSARSCCATYAPRASHRSPALPWAA
jgi:hypothetical protein